MAHVVANNYTFACWWDNNKVELAADFRRRMDRIMFDCPQCCSWSTFGIRTIHEPCQEHFEYEKKPCRTVILVEMFGFDKQKRWALYNENCELKLEGTDLLFHVSKFFYHYINRRQKKEETFIDPTFYIDNLPMIVKVRQPYNQLIKRAKKKQSFLIFLSLSPLFVEIKKLIAKKIALLFFKEKKICIQGWDGVTYSKVIAQDNVILDLEIFHQLFEGLFM